MKESRLDDRSDDNEGSNSPPRSVKVINYDEDEEVQSFPLYYENDQIKEVEVVLQDSSMKMTENNLTDLQRHASNFEEYRAAESIVVKDLKASEDTHAQDNL